LQFNREVTPAGADITKAIVEGIGSAGEPGRLYEQAENIKREIGITSESSREGITDKSTSLSKISFLVRPVLERLAAEIGRSLDYYRSQFNEERIDRILLTGGGANLKNIVSYLANELRLAVEHFNPLKKILLIQKRSMFSSLIRWVQPSPSGWIGFTEPKRIELLPAEEPFLSKVQIGKLIPVLAPLITFFIFLAIIWYMNGQVTTLQKERDAKMAKIANLDTLQTKLKLLREKDLQMKEKLSQFPSSMIVSVPYRDILKGFNDILPDNVTLTLLSVQSKGKPLKKELHPKAPGRSIPKDEGRELYITGVAFGSDVRCLTALAQIIERLERSPLFENVKLVSADENKLYTQQEQDLRSSATSISMAKKERKTINHGAKK